MQAPITACHKFDRFELRPAERVLLVDGESARIGARAFDVLAALVERRNRIVSKNELMELVWPNLVVEENNLQVHVSTLRKLLGPAIIATIPGRGYRFTGPMGGQSEPAAVAPDAPPVLTASSAEGEATLIGREEDLGRLRDLILAHRLVSVVGAGGIGKTTLARALAIRSRDAFAEDACVVELAPLSDGEMVLTAVASALQVKLGSRPPLDAIVQAIGPKRMVIVVDNCEHLLHAVAELVEALRPKLAGVHWLVTSQEPLKLAGEQLYRLGALSLPLQATRDGSSAGLADVAPDDLLNSARQSDALRFFEARVRAADSRFVLDEANVATATEICRKLDGIALAIELAAARVPLLGLEGLNRRLGERLRVLAGGTRLGLARHQTMRAALEWSYVLLSPTQQTVFRRLGVFAGSFALEAAQKVAADTALDEWTVLDELGALVDKSLVVVEAEIRGEFRYRLLESMRQYAIERLDAAGETSTIRSRHLDVFVALADAARADAYGPRQSEWNRRLHLDHENFLAAHVWCEALEDGWERDLRLVAGLHRYWINRALQALGYRISVEALGRPGAQKRNRLRREVLTQAGRLAGRACLYAQASAAHAEAIAIAREIKSPDDLADALSQLGMLRMEEGNLPAARVPLGEALALAECIRPDSDVYAGVATALGELERLEGNLDRARVFYEKALAQCRSQGEQRGIGANLNNLAMTAILMGRVDDARQWLAESYGRINVLQVDYGPMLKLLLSAGLLALQKSWKRAAQLDAAAIHHMYRVGWPPDAADKAYADTMRAHMRAALGDAEFEAVAAAGRAMSYEDALAALHQQFQPTVPSGAFKSAEGECPPTFIEGTRVAS